jgi:hypothetical protein
MAYAFEGSNPSAPMNEIAPPTLAGLFCYFGDSYKKRSVLTLKKFASLRICA